MTLQEVITLAINGHRLKATNGEFTYTERAFKNADYWTQKDVLADWRVIGMSKTPKYEKIVEKYLEELEHFFIPGIGGWPIILEGKRHERLMKLVPCLYINESNRLALRKNAKPDPRLMLELYKYKYEEINNMYNKLYNKVPLITKEF